jgi:hypothetical protein
MALQIIKNIIKRTFLYDVIKQISWRKEVLCWHKKGKPVPPPHLVKQRTVKEYARKFSIRTLVETGTCCGDMVNAPGIYFIKSSQLSLIRRFMNRRKRSLPNLLTSQ